MLRRRRDVGGHRSCREFDMAVKLLACVILGAALTLTGCSTTDTASQAASAFQGDAPMSVLTNSTGGGLGLTQTQAAGGLGSVMSLASSKLPAADYASLGKVLPNADKYIAAAQNAGVLTDPITDVGRLNSAMRKLGISPDKASSMLGQVSNYVGKVGGDSTQDTLTSLWR
jgi:Protein of unknown function VcgC/VcgE (DUF2780)